MKYLLALLFLVASPAWGQQAGVDIQHYEHHLTLTDASNTIAGESHITVQFTDAGIQTLHLDLIGKSGANGMAVQDVRSGASTLAYSFSNDVIAIDLGNAPDQNEQRTITVRYEGIPADGLIIAKNKHGDRTFFGDNWPNRARHWLPSIDHPSDKATYAFIITAPDHYQVVSTGSLIEELDLDDGRRRTHWETEVPIPTKVAVIGAARFAVRHEAPFNGIPVQSWLYPQDREAGYHDFGVTNGILQFLEDNIGPFPYEKLANVQSKTRYGGMENASNIFYSENRISGTRQNEGLVAHEIAHQWFGNSVTEIDWPHVWLSEGFATYFTQLYFEHAYGVERMRTGMAQGRASVLRFYDRVPDAPIINPAIEDPNQHLNPNSYQKGGWVLHMLRREVGDEAFWAGIRDYYATHRDENASSADLQAVMERSSGKSLDTFFSQWLYQPGQPIIEGEWSAKGSTITVQLRQTQPGDAFDISIDLGIKASNGELSIKTVRMEDRTATFELEAGTDVVDLIVDPETWLLAKVSLERTP